MIRASRSLPLASILLVGTAISFSAPALAQVASPAVPAEGQAAIRTTVAGQANADEIVVTARLRGERSIDVPTSVTALGPAEIQRYATSDFSSLGTQVPQVQVTQGPVGVGVVATIRGIGTNTVGDEGVEQAVSFIIDGISTSRGRIVRQALFDLANVQVLKGPQTLYFGKNSPGGVIITESNGPTDSLEGYARVGYEFQAKEVIGEAAIGGPITDTLGFRIAARASDMSGGYVRNVSQPISAANSTVAYDRINGINLPGASYKWGPGAEQYAGRLTLDWTPGDFQAVFKMLASHYRSNGDTSEVMQLTCPTGFPNGAMRDLGALAFGGPIGLVIDPSGECDPKKRRTSIGALPPELANFDRAGDGKPYITADNYLGSLKLTYALGKINLTSITGYYHYKNFGLNNQSYNTQALIVSRNDSKNTSWTQEFRAITDFDGGLNASLGAFYQHDKRSYYTASTLLRARDPVTGTFINGTGFQTTRGEAYSAVGELIWKIVPELEFSGGARYTKETKNSSYQSSFVQSGIVSALNLYLPVGPVRNVKFKADNVSPQATLSWKPNADTNIFVGYRTGFKSGGISNPGLLPPTAANPNTLVFDNEKVKGYEGGVKFRALDRHINGSLVMYHYQYTGLQVSSFDSATSTLRIQNAGSAQIDGVEADLNFRVTPEFSLRGNAAYNRGRFTSFPNAQCYGGQVAATGCVNSQQNLAGRRLPRAPDWAGAVGATWDHPVNSNMYVGLSVDGRYSSGYFFTSTLAPVAFQKGYAVLDASLRLYQSDHRWEFAVIGKNLTDKFYATFGTDRPLSVQPGAITGVAGLPRTVQLQATYNF